MLRYDAKARLGVDLRLSFGSASTVTTLANRVGSVRFAEEVSASKEEEEMCVEAYNHANH